MIQDVTKVIREVLHIKYKHIELTKEGNHKLNNRSVIDSDYHIAFVFRFEAIRDKILGIY